MASRQRSINAELIRYRIEKRMAGRRDLLLHLLVYLGVAVIFRMNVSWFELVEYYFVGGLWTIPLVLHALRYYYRCGPGAVKRADEIERAIDEQGGGTALDEDEEILIEERVSKRVLARRVLVAHGITSIMILGIYVPFFLEDVFRFDIFGYLIRLFAYFATAFALHAIRFFFVHGRSPTGRAIKIEAEVEREWHRARERSQAWRDHDEIGEESPALVIGELQGRRLRLTAEGEFDQDIDDAAGAADRSAHS